MIENVTINCHSSIKIKGKKIIYVDPFNIEEEYKDADYIFITHSHYDHYSLKDIKRIMKEDTIIIFPINMKKQIFEDELHNMKMLGVEVNEKYNLEDIKFKTTFAYNKNKEFHPKCNNWVGYILEFNNEKIYIAGDTDVLQENENIKCDIAFVPIGGYYTMTYTEAAEYINKIKPKIVVPVHYGSIVGKLEFADKFLKLISKDIKCKILINKINSK